MMLTGTNPNVALGHRIRELSLNDKELELSESNTDEQAWLLSARKDGTVRFAELGIPTVHDEDWRFTSVSPIAKLAFKPVLEPAHHGVTGKALSQFPFPALGAASSSSSTVDSRRSCHPSPSCRQTRR